MLPDAAGNHEELRMGIPILLCNQTPLESAGSWEQVPRTCDEPGVGEPGLAQSECQECGGAGREALYSRLMLYMTKVSPQVVCRVPPPGSRGNNKGGGKPASHQSLGDWRRTLWLAAPGGREHAVSTPALCTTDHWVPQDSRSWGALDGQMWEAARALRNAWVDIWLW